MSHQRGGIQTIGWFLTILTTCVVAWSLISWKAAAASTAAVCCSRWLVRKTTRPFDPQRVTIASFWYLSYLGMIFLPAFFVYVDQEGPFRARFLFAVESVLVTVPLGWWLANSFFGSRRRETVAYFCGPIETLNLSPRFAVRFWSFLAISILLMVGYILEVPAIPLRYLLVSPGDYIELAILRDESLKLLDSPLMYAYYLTRSLLFPFLTMVSLGCYLQGREKKWLRIFLLTLLLGLLYASLSLAKAPVSIILLLLGVFAYLYAGGKVNRKLVTAFLVLVFLFPVVVIVSTSSDSDVGVRVALKVIGQRLFYMPAEIVYYYFEVFPGQVPYLHGRTISKFALLTAQEYFNSANYVGQYAFPQYLESVYANGAFIADLNADFGLYGVVVGGLLAGFTMQALHIYLIRGRKTVVNLACYAFLMIGFWFLNSVSLPVVLASNGVLLAVALKWSLEQGSGESLPRLSGQNSFRELSAETGHGTE